MTKKRFKTKFSDAELAEVLLFQEREGFRKASARYNVNERTLRRKREAFDKGQLPEVSRIVEAQQAQAAARVGDLLTETYEAVLQRILALAPDATIEQALKAAEVLGELRVTRDVLNGGTDTSSKQGPKAPDPAGQLSAGGAAGARRAPAGPDGALAAGVHH